MTTTVWCVADPLDGEKTYHADEREADTYARNLAAVRPGEEVPVYPVTIHDPEEAA